LTLTFPYLLFTKGSTVPRNIISAGLHPALGNHQPGIAGIDALAGSAGRIGHRAAEQLGDFSRAFGHSVEVAHGLKVAEGMSCFEVALM
jgi:hypothetical protein